MESFLIDVPVPSMGATVNELTVIDIKVTAGTTVAKGAKLAELESDKSVFEFEAPCAGRVIEWKCRAGDIVPSGVALLRMETTDASQRHLLAAAASASVAVSSASPVPAPVAAPAAPVGLQWTPRATKLAQEAGLDPAKITDIGATGPGGRVSGDDVARYLEQHKAAPAAAAPAAPAAPAVAPSMDDTVCIAGGGVAVPENVMATGGVLEDFPDRQEGGIFKLTGIRERRYAGENESATDLAVVAVQHALKQAGITADSLDGVIMATLIPDQPVPSMASRLARQIGAPHALAFDLNAACAGWLYALEVGRAFIRGGTGKKILVVTAELLSRITNPKDKETAFLFGDGSGAAVLTSDVGGHRLHRMSLSGDANAYDAIQRTGGGALRPVPHPSGSDRDHFYLQMDGGAVFKAAVKAFADKIEVTMKQHGLTPDQVGWVVPHQANERILKAVSKRVGIPYEKFVMTISKYGNTSAASVSMALGWAAEEGIFHSGDRIIFCSVGAGLTFAGGLLVW